MPTRVSQAIGGFAQYLQGENIRLREEDRKQRINDAAEHISREFQGLGPDASLQEIAGLGYSLVNDAAQYGALQESLPLIQNFMQTAQVLRQAGIEETQGNILAASLHEMDPNVPYDPDATGQTQSAIYGAYQQGKRNVDITKKSGSIASVTYDAAGNVIPGSEIITNEQTDVSKANFELEVFGLKKNIEFADWQRKEKIKQANALSQINYKVGLGLTKSGKFAMANGLQEIKTYVGKDSRPLYKDGQGGTYQIVRNPTGQLEARIYKGPLQTPKSDLETLQKAQDVIATYGTLAGTEATTILTAARQDADDNKTPSGKKIDEIFKGMNLGDMYNEEAGKWVSSPRTLLKNLTDAQMQELKVWSLERGGTFDEDLGKYTDYGALYNAIESYELAEEEVDKATGEYIPTIVEPYDLVSETGGKTMQVMLQEDIIVGEEQNEFEVSLVNFFKAKLGDDNLERITELQYQLLTPDQQREMDLLIFNSFVETEIQKQKNARILEDYINRSEGHKNF